MAPRLRVPPFGRALPWGLAALSLVIAFVQRGRLTYVDTRVELTANPGLFLDRVTSVWSPTVDLGHVQSGQYVGYLFPMGPYFDWAHSIGVPLWFAERLWLAAILWLAGLGVVRLLDAIYDRRRSAVHLVAAVLFSANPYVVVQANRASASLLAYAALPWIMLAAHRGLRDPRGWTWPAVVALAFASSSGGTNAALVFWVAVAPIALLTYEVTVLHRRRGDAIGFAWRAALLSGLASAWWVLPALIAGREGPNFLAFTEQPNAIWATTSMSESVRLMGYWLSYFESGFGGAPQATSTAVRPYLENDVVVAATFAVPLLAFGGLLLTRRWRYASFFALLAVGALLVMAAGYPAGKPAAGTLEAVYYQLPSTQFLRTTYKAGPLVALALACLAGAAAGRLLELASRVTEHPNALRLALGAALAVVMVLFAYPLARGRLIEPQFAYGSVPSQWRTAMADAARATPGGRRILVLPGQLFGAYRWGQTVDPPIAPVLTTHPVLQRTVGHYADPRSTQLQEVVDDLIQQGRLTPGQLAPLLRLMGVGSVVVATDGRGEQSGESPPATIAESLSEQAGFAHAAAAYGAARAFRPLRGQGGPTVILADLRRYDAPGASGERPVRLAAVDGSIVLDGDAAGIAQLAAVGALNPNRALFYAGDLDRDAIQRMVRTGAELVFSDSNRRRRVNPAVILGDFGPALAARERIPRDVPAFDLFPARGTEGQTVAEYGDLSFLRAPSPGRNSLSGERRASAVFDGSLDTSWRPPAPLPDCPCLELALRRPRDVRYIRIHPRAEGPSAVPLGIAVNGGPERQVDLSRLGWNRIRVDGRPLRTLRIRVIDRPFVATTGIDEVEIPGVTVTESLRLPTWLAEATRGLDLSGNAMRVDLSRATGDFPFRPSSTDEDGRERTISRMVTLPATRRFGISGWASPSEEAPDPVFDRLAGMPAGWRLEGSSRFEGVPGRRASSAFDGDTSTAWVADFGAQRRAWLSLSAPRPFRVRELRLAPGPSDYAFPASLDVQASGRTFRDLRPGPRGDVVLPDAVTTRFLRLDVTAVEAPPASAQRNLGAVALGEVHVPGLHVLPPRRAGRFITACGDVQVHSALGSGTGRVAGDLAALDRGTALTLKGCGQRRAVSLPRRRSLVTATGSTMLPYLLSLRSPAPRPSPPPVSPGVVKSDGDASDGSRTGVRLDLRHPAWLVLGESYARGWRAICRTRSGAKRGLGAPTAIDGFANGWRVRRSCATVDLTFGPQRLATASYIVSAIAGAVVLALLGLALLRRRRRPPAAAEAQLDGIPADPVRRLSPAWALTLGAAVGLAGGWFFAIRAGLVLGLAVAVLTWAGISARRLLWASLVLLAAVPVEYVLGPGIGDEGVFRYADNHQTGHWLAVGAVCALAGACLLDARARRHPGTPARREA